MVSIPQWYCPDGDCVYRSQSKSHVTRHIKETHYGERRFHCEICFRKFFRKNDLDRHKKRHLEGKDAKPLKIGKYHSESEWSCPYFSCDFKALYKNHVTEHILTHSEDEVYFVRCNFCTKQRYKSKSYTCKHCDSALSRRYYGLD